MLVSEEGVKTARTREKTGLRSKEEKKQQTHPTFDAEFGNPTWATLVGGAGSYYFFIPDPREKNRFLITFLFDIFGREYVRHMHHPNPKEPRDTASRRMRG